MRCCCPLAVELWKKNKKSLTVFMRPHSSGRAAGAVAGRREAQHRGVILGELLQTRHVAHVDAVLEVWSHCHHGNLLLFTRLPGEQLEQDSGGGGEKKCECEKSSWRCPLLNSHTFASTNRTRVSQSRTEERRSSELSGGGLAEELHRHWREEEERPDGIPTCMLMIQEPSSFYK